MAVSKAQQRAVSRYVKKSYDSIILRIPKGERDKIRAFAELRGMSLNAFIYAAIKNEMEGKSL